jgi:hypothetical protein
LEESKMRIERVSGVLVLYMLCGTAYAGGVGALSPMGGVTVVADDFESGDLSKWSLDTFNNWGQVIQWNLVQDGTQVWEGSGGFPPPWGGGGNSVQYLTGFNGSDVSVRAQVKTQTIINGGFWSGIAARYTDPWHFYILQLSGDVGTANHLLLGKSDNITNEVGHVATAPLAHAILPENVLGSWNTLRLDVVGNHLTAYFNDTLYFDVYDSALTSGSVGLMNAGGVTRFDNFSVATVPSVVPLPGTFLLSTMGIGIAGWLRRRRAL